MAEKPDVKEVKKRKDTLADFKAEYRQIKWPSRKELRKQVVTVIITCIIVTIGIFVMDYSISFGLDGLGRVAGIEAFDFWSQFDLGDFATDDVFIDQPDFDIDWDELDLGFDLSDLPEGVQIDIVDAEDVPNDAEVLPADQAEE